MEKHHGFFIPDIEYLHDLEGLITYLGEKVAIGNVCLYCNTKSKIFSSLEAVQDHMTELSHCKLYYDPNDGELDDFYDFSADWKDIPHEEGENGEIIAKYGVYYHSLTDKRPTFTVSEDGSELIFTNGKTIGHRSFCVFYRQRFRTEDTRSCIEINKALSQHRAIGWHGTQGQLVATKDIKAEKKFAHSYMRLGIKANKLQKHYRDPLLQ